MLRTPRELQLRQHSFCSAREQASSLRAAHLAGGFLFHRTQFPVKEQKCASHPPQATSLAAQLLFRARADFFSASCASCRRLFISQDAISCEIKNYYFPRKQKSCAVINFNTAAFSRFTDLNQTFRPVAYSSTIRFSTIEVFPALTTRTAIFPS